MAIQRPVTVLMACVAVLLLGSVSFGGLRVDLLPDIGTPRITLLTTADTGALAPQEVERLITAPLENQVQTVSGVRRVTSTSREGMSVIPVEFPWGTNLDIATLHIREAVDKVRQQLPDGVERPAVLRWDPGSEPVMGLAVAGGGNHRGSIFRLHVGTALLACDESILPKPQSWGKGASAKRAVRESEKHVERAISEYIGSMPFLYVVADDESGKQSIRKTIEQNSITLLSLVGVAGSLADPPSAGWLGHFCRHEAVQRSGLWNVQHVEDDYNSGFLDVLENCTARTQRP